MTQSKYQHNSVVKTAQNGQNMTTMAVQRTNMTNGTYNSSKFDRLALLLSYPYLCALALKMENTVSGDLFALFSTS